MASLKSRRTLVALAAVVVIIIDQVTKTLAEVHLASHSVELFGPFSLQLFYNSGVAFSLGAGNASLALALETAVLVVLIWYAGRVRTKTLAIGFGMIIGGALGNVSDRIFRHNHGAVIDFIHSGFWPTFNVADSAVVIGIVVILLGSRRNTGSA